MTLLKKTFLTAGLIVALASTGYSTAAEKAHAHKAPHGGVVQEAEGIHAEFVVDKNGEPKLYLYDRSMKPLDRSEGEPRVTVKGHGGAEQTRTLKYSKDPKEGPVFKGEPMKGMAEWDSAVVNMKLNDKSMNMNFSRKSDGHGHGH